MVGIELLHCARAITLVLRYSRPSMSCHMNITATARETQDKVTDTAHLLTAAMYGLCSILRILEYMPIFIQLFLWYKDKNSVSVPDVLDTEDFSKPPRVLIFIILVFAACLGLTIPVVGTAVEFHNGKREGCGVTTSFSFYIYCFFNIFRYAWAYNIRAAMVISTLTIKKIWEEVPKHDGDMNAIRLHASLTDQYVEAGERVKRINEVFQAWFLFPWVIFFIASSVDTRNTVAIWGEVDNLPMIYLLLYHINQILLLLIPYMCGRKINHYNRLCVIKIQDIQLKRTRSDRFRAQQRKMLIQREDMFDFVPRVWGLGFKVKMNSLIYIVFLLLGIFLTIFNALL